MTTTTTTDTRLDAWEGMHSIGKDIAETYIIDLRPTSPAHVIPWRVGRASTGETCHDELARSLSILRRDSFRSGPAWRHYQGQVDYLEWVIRKYDRTPETVARLDALRTDSRLSWRQRLGIMCEVYRARMTHI